MTPARAQAPPRSGPGLGRALRGLAWLAPGLALLPFAWAFGFCFPRGDDFDEVTRSMFLFDLPGGLYEVGREWLAWSGRYTYHFLAVFLGKAGELRPVCGLVCGAALALHGLAVYGLARAAAVPRRFAATLACLALLGLCAGTRCLPGCYLLTEALTTGLQSAAALGFFWSLCALWERCAASPADETGIRRARRRAALLGVLAAGVYEHAALAVLAGAGVACVLAWFHDRRGAVPGAGRARGFIVVSLWCLGGALLSFLAPGNFARRAARGLDADMVRAQLAAIPTDWLAALTDFARGPLPLTALGLAALVALLRKRGRPGLEQGEALLLAALIPAAFGLFSAGVTGLHALSDVPLHASAKLGASLGLYAACALAFSAAALLRALSGLPLRGRGPALLVGACLLALCCSSHNFQRTLQNAVNGDMALYAEAMQRRDAWLRHVGAASPWAGKPRFGLVGEMLYPGSRSRDLSPGAAVTPVARWPWPVFPVLVAEGLRNKAAQWPNPWAAWMYGVDAVAALPPDPAAAVAALRRPADARQGPQALHLPQEARALGLASAWRVNAQGGANPTFALTWLVLESEKPLPKTLAVLAPSPLSPGRMAPLFAQAWLLRRLAQKPVLAPDVLAHWAGRRLSFPSGRHRVPADAAGRFRYALPLGPAAPLAAGAATPAPGEWPAVLFLKAGDKAFLRLAPARDDLDSGPESG